MIVTIWLPFAQGAALVLKPVFNPDKQSVNVAQLALDQLVAGVADALSLVIYFIRTLLYPEQNDKFLNVMGDLFSIFTNEIDWWLIFDSQYTLHHSL